MNTPKVDRWIDRETALKLLRRVCNFLTCDDSGVADFKIPDGKEALVMSAYTGAFYIQDSDHKVMFKSTASPFRATEPLTLVPMKSEHSSEIIPILSPPLSGYLKLFPDISGQKYLFMADTSKYYSPSYFKATSTIYSEYYHVAIMERFVKELLERLAKGLFFKGYRDAASFIRRNARMMVTFAEMAMEGMRIPYTSNVIERLMGEVSKRCKNR